MGLALTGSAVGGLALPLVVWALDTYGWRPVTMASGVILLVAGLPLAQIVRHRPERYGLLPDGRDPAGDASEFAADDSDDDGSFTAREAMRTRAFWFISLAHAAAVLVRIGRDSALHGARHGNPRLQPDASGGGSDPDDGDDPGRQDRRWLPRRPRQLAGRDHGLHARPRRGAAVPHVRAGTVDGDCVRRAQRPRVGRSRAGDHRHAGGVFRPAFVRNDHGVFRRSS